MNRKWIVILLVLTAAISWAKGTQEKDFQDAGRGNFSQTVDLTKLQPGPYNVLVRAKDAAGNVAYAGPYNFFYDPKSDNPLITIANPTPGTRVAGSMNFVGVSSAPKGTGQVEVKIDDGAWTPAQGKAFWSYRFDAGPFKDGLHRVFVRGTDVNGVVGPVSSAAFFLDQHPPELTLTSLKSGDRVQGEIAIEGTLADGNGLRRLEYSLDQKAAVRVDLQGDQKAASRRFRAMLDTRKQKDGPLVLWMHGVDGQGSEVRQAFLLYVDNKVPVITVLWPKPDQGLHGKVRFLVMADKLMGLKSLTAKAGDKGELVSSPIVAGNPFHAMDVTLPEHGSGSVPVLFEAVDTSGKIGRLVFQAKLNGDVDLPVVTVASPASGARVTGEVRLVGTLAATDGPAGIAWSVGSAAETVEPVGAAFDFPLKGLVSGVNKITVTGVDKNGKRGKPTVLLVTALLGAPTLEWTSASWSGQDVPFRPGLNIGPDRKAKLTGKVTWPSPMKTLTWTLGNGKPLLAAVAPADKTGASAFTLALPDDPPLGPVPVEVTATDAYGQTATLKSFVDIDNLSKPKDGLAFADARLGQPVVAVTPESPLKAVFSGGEVKKAELVGTGNAAAFSIAPGRIITVSAAKDGVLKDAKLRVTDERGRVWDADLGTLSSDTAPPSLTLTAPASGQWVTDKVKLEGKAADANGIAKLEWSTDGQSWQDLDAPKPGGAFSQEITLPAPDDAYRLFVRATDGGGRAAWAQTVVRRDTVAPAVDLVFPEAVSGAYAVGRLRDEALKDAEITFDGMTIPLRLDRPFAIPIDGPQTLKFRLTDWAGNVTETAVDAAGTPGDTAKPTLQILYPPAGTPVSGVIPVTGRVSGFRGKPVVAVQGAPATPDVTDAGYFTVDIDTAALKNRSLTVTAAGEDKQLASATLALPAEPASAKARPAPGKPPLDAPAGAAGWLGGRGALSYTWQLDGGAKTTVNAPDAAPLGTFFVDLSGASAGIHKVAVIPVDASGNGAPVTVDVVVPGPPGKAEFSADLGAPLAVAKDTKLPGRLTGGPWRKTEYRFADLSLPDGWTGAFQPLVTQKDGSFAVPVPTTLPFGRIGVAVRAEDTFGQVVETRTYFERVWPSAAPVEDKDGLYFVDQRLDDQGKFQTSPGTPLVGTFRGRPLKSVTLVPAVPGVEVTNDGGVLSVTAAADGVYGPFQIAAVTVDNETFRAGPFTIAADSGGPALDWTTPQNADWIQDSVSLTGSVSAASGLAALEVSFDGAQWSPVAVAKDGSFHMPVKVTGDDGLTRVFLRATDKTGRTALASRAVTKDASAPTVQIIAPPEDRKINGLTTIAGVATDLNPVASIEYSDDGKKFQPADGTNVFAFDLNLQSYAKLPEHFYVRSTDASGNQAVTPLDLPIDQETDKPTVQIQTPTDGEVETADFQITGMAFDDDAVQSLEWRIDGGAWTQVQSDSSFRIPVALSGLTDNEHTVEVRAEDIYGTKGDIVSSKFKVSLVPPSAVLLAPQVETTSNGIVSLVGASFDRNGIAQVQISLDNGLNWNQASLRDTEKLLAGSGLPEAAEFKPDQRKEWEWRFDSHTLKDGTYLVMVKTTDSLGVEGLLTTLLSVDNTDPLLTLSGPLDGENLLDSVDLDGRSSDNVDLVSLKAELRSEAVPPASAASKGAKAPAVPAAALGPVILSADLPVTPTFRYHWDLGSLTPGWYNIRLEAKDKAGNTTFVARNVRIEGASGDHVDLFFPQAGQSLTNNFFVEGRVSSRVPVSKVAIALDGKSVEADVDAQGYFSLAVDDQQLADGGHTVQASIPAAASEPRSFSFQSLGPWVKVESHHTGSYVTQRPFLTGIAGWKDEAMPAGAKGKEADDYRRKLESHRVAAVEVSLDNGKSFALAQGTGKWKFRIESLGLPDGPLPLLVRAKFRDGTFAYQKLLVTVLQTPPVVKLLTAVENGRFNLTLPLAGYTEDADAAIAVRQGDKGGYEVPAFIQGAFLDAQVWGATYYSLGAGLTFFQDAVKLQAQYGQAPPDSRFFGTVTGAKLIASVAQLPMGYFFGPDWNWLSSSFGVGANFSVFSMGPGIWSSDSVFLGGIVLQWEVAKATLRDLTAFKSYAWYLEMTSWFISSDVQAEAKLTASTGIRIGLF